jgi:hypothetical protein
LIEFEIMLQIKGVDRSEKQSGSSSSLSRLLFLRLKS